MAYPTFKTPTVDELRDGFILEQRDDEVLRGHGDVHRLGLAVLLKTQSWLGYVPHDKDEIPPRVVEWVAAQLKLEPALFKRYSWSSRTRRRHMELIRQRLETHPFESADEQALSEHLVGCAAHSPTGAKLLARAIEWCRDNKAELPNEPTLRRITNSTRARFFEQLYNDTAARLGDETCASLERSLCECREDNATTFFDWVKTSPGRVGLRTILDEVAKLQFIRATGVDASVCLPGGSDEVRKLLRDRARAEKATLIRRHPRAVRLTLLAALFAARRTEITDNVVRILLELIRKVDRKAKRSVEQQLARNAPKVFGKTALLFRIAQAIKERPDATVRDVLFPIIGEEVLDRLIAEATADEYDVVKSRLVQRKYVFHYRRMMKPVLEALNFCTDNPAHAPLKRGLELVQRYLGSKHTYYPETESIPDELLSGSWRALVVSEAPDGMLRYEKHPFEVCVLTKLDQAIRCKEIWVEGAYRFRNPAEDLPQDWDEHRESHYARCGVSLDAEAFIDAVRTEMTEALDGLNSFFGAADAGEVAIRHPGGGERGVFYVPPLPNRGERPILAELKDKVIERWGVLDLVDILVEADRQVGFAKYFETSGQRQVLSADEVRSRLLLVLFSLGTNLGLQRIHAAARPGCTYDDLRYFRDRFVTVPAVRRSIVALVNRILEVRQRRIWGEATSCASDGKHLGAWDQNLTAKWNPHYGGCGVMAYWHVATNSTCIYSALKAPLSSEVAAMIEGLVRHDTEMRVERNFVDSHGQSEVAFAFARFLNFVLAPRLKRIKYERLYLPELGLADRYPNLAGVLAVPIRWELIREQYDEMVRHIVAVKDGIAPIDSILRRFSRFNRAHPTYRAFIQLGKALKTTFLCRYLSSLELRQEINDGLNVVESWNAVNDFIFYGRKSEVSTNDPEQQELGVLCLHLLQNAVILVNTVLAERVLIEDGLLGRMSDEDKSSLTPLFTANINPYGDFAIDLSKPSFLLAA